MKAYATVAGPSRQMSTGDKGGAGDAGGAQGKGGDGGDMRDAMMRKEA